METSSNMMLNSFARFRRSSLILAETISRFVINSEADISVYHRLEDEG
jgi:hypothetical protein